MQASRRQFLGAAAGVALAAQAGSATPTAPLTRRTGGDLLSRMSWLNEPAQVHYSEGVLSARSRGKTDFWRKTYFGYVTDNGHLLQQSVAGDFTAQVKVSGAFRDQYDQAGLMVRLTHHERI